MSFYPVAVDGELLDLSLFEDGPLNERLQVAQNRRQVIHCHCHEGRGEPAPASPLRLTPVRRGVDYHLRRDPDDADAHHADCRHFTLSSCQLAQIGLSTDALRVSDEGELRINLDFGLGESGDRDIAAAIVQYHHPDGKTTQTRSRASLLGLLHLLWARAELNRHDPRRRLSGPGPWERLRQVARHTVPNSMRSLSEHGLSSILLLPTNATAEASEQARRNRAKLFEAHKKRRVMFACQLDPHLLEARNAGGFADLYPAFGVGLTVHGDLITQMLEQHPSERAALATGQAVIAIGVAKVWERSRGRLAATVERMALMGVTDRYIPVESSYWRALAEYLEATGRSYMKPLKHDAADLVHPDFVLTDTPAQVALEVYGMDTPDYLARKAEKQELYAQRLPGRHWQWEALHERLEVAVRHLPAPMNRA
ncbi:DUF1173 family protein [Ideonella sp. B7]|uniref:DUF1173 family protein n=1 Tax=Ideonella benzenivorans TaxID=2831643 RepID=UPI001CED4E45|nr:DUF1173 family protein [Ideonella benzenivorans]MCA6218952.1 DUF1173 family protein [Ideonella benzenivorans]